VLTETTVLRRSFKSGWNFLPVWQESNMKPRKCTNKVLETGFSKAASLLPGKRIQDVYG
jgi:hypothetical protein